MMILSTVARLYRFRATHSLPDFPEPWCHPHQHDYTVEVVALGGTPTDKLDARWAEVVVPTDMNEVFTPSTVEQIAEEMLAFFGDLAVSVTVWEDQQRWGRAERR